MSTLGWLRLASALALFQALGHTFGSVLPSPVAGSPEASVRETMAAFRFSVGGMERSYLDAYLGSGWIISAMLFGSSILIWLLAREADLAPQRVRPLLLTLAALYGSMTVVGAVYFVLPPTLVAGAVTGCLCVGVARVGRH
ncbi:MAG: hypothetical protein SFU84_15115 [Gemmatimonadales bacterium]|nr:hypothetical protein [Gemmatimonadales bacterium]